MTESSRFLAMTHDDLCAQRQTSRHLTSLYFVGVFDPKFQTPRNMSLVREGSSIEVSIDLLKIDTLDERLSEEICSLYKSGMAPSFWAIEFESHILMEEYCTARLVEEIGRFQESLVPSPLSETQRQKYLARMTLKEFIDKGWVNYPYLVCRGNIATLISGNSEGEVDSDFGKIRITKRPVFLTGHGFF